MHQRIVYWITLYSAPAEKNYLKRMLELNFKVYQRHFIYSKSELNFNYDEIFKVNFDSFFNEYFVWKWMKCHSITFCTQCYYLLVCILKIHSSWNELARYETTVFMICSVRSFLVWYNFNLGFLFHFSVEFDLYQHANTKSAFAQYIIWIFIH